MHKQSAEQKQKQASSTRRGIGTFLAGIVLVLTPFIVEHVGYRGQIMVADPQLDAPFDRSLVLIDQHGVEGAVGIVINKSLTDAQRAQLSPFIRDEPIPVGYGGPLETSEKLVVLEEKPPKKAGGKPRLDLEFWDDAVRLTPDLLARIRESTQKGEQHYRVFAGYAYWSPFQLESEVLVRKKWTAIPFSHEILFQDGKNSHWDVLYRQERSKHQPEANRS